MIQHIRSSKVKMSSEHADFGYRTLCGEKVYQAPTGPSGIETCRVCLKSLMMKLEEQLASYQEIMESEES